MGNTHPQRWTVAHTLDEAADFFADLFLAAEDADDSRFLSTLRPDRYVYPTRIRAEEFVRKALTPWSPEWPGYGVSADFPDGITLEDLFEKIVDFILADDGDDSAAVEAAVVAYERIRELSAPEGSSMVEAAVTVMASGDAGSVWYAGVTKALPNHPQTPGSDAYKAAQAAGNPTESVSNPFRGLTYRRNT